MRGDSGMSDSQFLRFQNLMKDKYNKISSKWDREEKQAKPFKLKKDTLTFWEKVKKWITQ